MQVMKNKAFLIFFLLFSVNLSRGQEAEGLPQKSNVVLPAVLAQIEYPRQVDTLLVSTMDYRLKYHDEGYRVLFFSQSGNRSKNAAIEAKADFDLIYPEYKSYILFEEPYFKVKAGNFKHRMEAGFFLRIIKQDYPYAFIVKDVLDVAEYLEQEK